MNAEKCLQILRDVKDIAFATVDSEGKPQVRIIDVMLVEDNILYFCTSRGKHFHEELMMNRTVAVTGMNRDYQMVRLAGKVERLDQQKKWIDRIFEENMSMNDVYPGSSRYILDAFCIKDGELEFFDLGSTPIYRESFTIGDETMSKKGFEITSKCIKCGICKRACPQQCIVQGEPYCINPYNCLHCGLCYESCPTKAIERIR